MLISAFMTSEVTSILELQDRSIENNLDCLTIYRSISNWSETIIKSKLQNQLKALLKDCPNKLDGRQIQQISENIMTQVLTLNFYKKSVGIFVSLDTSDPMNIEVSLNKNLLVLFSDEVVEDEQVCGKIFSLKNLFKMTSLFHDTLCIYIAKKETRFYELNSEFKLVDKMDNLILERYEDRFRYKTPGVQGATHGGSAADEKEDKFNKTTLNDVIKRLKKIAKKQNRYKYMIVFVTSEFAGYENFIEPEFSYYSETKPVILKREVDKEENFEAEFKKALNEKYYELTKEKIEKYTTSIDGLFITELDEIVKAGRESRIHKLYLKENFSSEGYILTKDLPYSNKVDGSTETNQLIDWLIRKVLETKGEVFVLDQDSEIMSKPIAARLRY